MNWASHEADTFELQSPVRILRLSKALGYVNSYESSRSYILNQTTVACAIFGVITLFSLLVYWGSRKRIPLASLLLKTVMDITAEHPSVYFVAMASLIVQAALSVYVHLLKHSHMGLSD